VEERRPRRRRRSRLRRNLLFYSLLVLFIGACIGALVLVKIHGEPDKYPKHWQAMPSPPPRGLHHIQ